MLQVERQIPQVPLGVEHVPVTGNALPGRRLTGPQSRSAVGHGVVRTQGLGRQLQQANAPSGLVAMVLFAQQVAIGALDIRADKDGLPGLVYLVVRPDANPAEVLSLVDIRAWPAAVCRMLWMVPTDRCG